MSSSNNFSHFPIFDPANVLASAEFMHLIRKDQFCDRWRRRDVVRRPIPCFGRTASINVSRDKAQSEEFASSSAMRHGWNNHQYMLKINIPQ